MRLFERRLIHEKRGGCFSLRLLALALFDLFIGFSHAGSLAVLQFRVTLEPFIQCLFRTEEVDNPSAAAHKQRR